MSANNDDLNYLLQAWPGLPRWVKWRILGIVAYYAIRRRWEEFYKREA